MQGTMLLGVSVSEAYGVHPGAWRLADREAYTDVDVWVDVAKLAERGGMDYLFVPDRSFLHEDLTVGPPIFPMEPLMVLAAVAHATRRIGLVTSASTSFSEPYTIARQLRALDVMSHGRAGWNAIPSYEPEAFANYGLPTPPRDKKYERLHEVIQVTQALWGSWRREAGEPDRATGRFADMRHIQPINLQGNQVGSRGPLQIPPSEQGQPVIFMPFASGASLQAAALYANGIISMPRTPVEGRQQVELLRGLAQQAGRRGDEIKNLPFLQVSLGLTEQDAAEHRVKLDRAAGMTLGGRGSANPLVVGGPEQAADFIEDWMRAGGGDGATMVFADIQHDLPIFVDHVIPILRRRGLRPADYRGATLRDHLGLAEQLGLDPRLRRGEEGAGA